MQIRTENLTYTYGKGSASFAVKALNGVTLTIPEGEFFGIIGKTGSGKSTFIQHLNGLIKSEKTDGKVIVGEFDLCDKNCDFKALRARVGMVFQYPEYQLFAETVKEDVAFGIKNFMPELNDAQIETAVAEALSAVGLDYNEFKDKSPFDLSGGQKRRVAIAGVIVTKPEVLILDEPAAGLDPKGKRDFLNLLHRLHKSFAKTVVIVSHDMNVISEHCTSVAVFDDGEISACGTPREVFTDNSAENLGLEAPVTAYLTEKLKEAGVTVQNDLTEDGFVEAVAAALRGEK